MLFNAVQPWARRVLCRIVRLSLCLAARPTLVTLTVLFIAVACSKKENPARGDDLPPPAKVSDAPDFIRALSLLYPQAELYRVADKPKGDSTGNILQKTNHPLGDVIRYYSEAMSRHGFAEVTRLVQSAGALLQFERADTKNTLLREVVSIDISQLPYSENLLIRIGRSTVDYGRGQMGGSSE